MIRRGDIRWIGFGEPRGRERERMRPVLVVQSDATDAEVIGTVLVIPLISNSALVAIPGNVLIPAGVGGLERDAVANVTQIGPVDRDYLDPRPLGRVPADLMRQVDAGLCHVLGLSADS
ncbi:type II toxin-antitoxin system PemK/MazF family toxin [Microbacterium rhizophilus]|uniref:type II toxin-antitoxin system PemK/MazF family toxin n=1 Tax=Microbacterium rhizophilus TaxID=3138934 RepID=UPI0031EC8408